MMLHKSWYVGKVTSCWLHVLSLGAHHVRLLLIRNDHSTEFQLLQLPWILILFLCYLSLLKTSLTVPAATQSHVDTLIMLN